jgi:hypothetical protein
VDRVRGVFRLRNWIDEYQAGGVIGVLQNLRAAARL